MQYKPTTLAQTIKRALLYAFMTIAVLVSAFVLVMFTMGYRFDRADRSVERIGLLQLGSQPSGARVHIDGTSFSKNTNTKTTLPEGSYTVEMRRKGYTTWRKTVPVKAGSVVWLTYPRLLPEKLTAKSVLEVDRPTSSLVAPNRKYAAMTFNRSAIELYDLSQSKPSKAVIDLEPAKDFRADKPAYEAVSWSPDSNQLIVKKSFGKSHEWLLVNRQEKTTLNLNKSLGINPEDIQLSPANTRYLYALSAGDLRKVDLKHKTLSRVLANNVKDFSLHESIVSYVTKSDAKTKERTVGILRDGIDLPIAIETAKDADEYYDIAVGSYYGDNYIAIVSGDTLRLYTGKLSGLRKEGDFEQVYELAYDTSLDRSVRGINFVTNGRFVAMQQDDGYSVYDVEMERLTVASQASLDGWLDGYLTYDYSSANQLVLREFDGDNSRSISELVIPGQMVSFDNKKENIYWLTEADGKPTKVSLMRLKIRL